MSPGEARRRFAGARIARLATADQSGLPHLVPLVFAIDGETLVSAVDYKPKRSKQLRRLANVRDNPQVAVLVDEYDEDWDRLWWARVDGSGSVLAIGSRQERSAIDLLVDRYAQYRALRPEGPVLAIRVQRWSGWLARDEGAKATTRRSGLP